MNDKNYYLLELDDMVIALNNKDDQINELEKENKKLKNLLKEIRGKIHYINTPKNQHNVFGNDIKEKINKILNDNS